MQRDEKEQDDTLNRHQQISSTLPFIFAYHSVASDKHPERNEDSLIADPELALAGVFDGVGGSRAGDIASQIAVRVIQQGWKQFLEQRQSGTALPSPHGEHETSTDLRASLLKLVEDAHTQIRAEGKQTNEEGTEDQATTIVLAAFCQEPSTGSYTMVYVSVGDSRLYLLRAQQALTCLTRDDSVLTRLVQRQAITEADALRIDQATHPDQLSEVELSYFHKRHGIMQALGDPQPLTIHIDETAIIPGDRIILCTDGIHDNLTNDEIEEIVKRADPANVPLALVEHAVQRSRQLDGGTMRAKPDDMTAVVITYQQ